MGRKILLSLLGVSVLFSAFNGISYSFPTPAGFEDIQTDKRHINGEITERFVDKLLTSEGWERIDTKYGSGQGIDLLYVKRNKEGQIKDVLVVESKYNKSTLGTASYGKQMSKEWILGSLDKKLEEINSSLKNSKNLSEREKLLKLRDELLKVRKLVLENRYRARVYKLEKLSEERYILKRANVPAGASAESLKNLKFETVREINLKGDTKIARILRETIKETYRERLLNTLNNPNRLRAITVDLSRFNSRVAETLKGIRYLKYASYGKGFLEAIPILGGIVGAVAQIGYDIAVAHALERIAKEQQLLGEKINALAKEQYLQRLVINELAQGQKELSLKVTNLGNKLNALAREQYAQRLLINQLAQRQDELYLQVATISGSLKLVKTQVEEIKKGIFKTGIELLRNYYITGDIKYLTDAIGHLIEARNVKNPKLEPLIDFYLTNAYAEKFKRTKNRKELILLKTEFKNLSQIVDRKNLNLLFTAYKFMADIPLEGKEQILKTTVGKFVRELIKERRFETALKLSRIYYTLTGDKTILTFALNERKKNYLTYKDFKNPKQLLEVLKENENSLLVKEAVRYLIRNQYFGLAKMVLRQYPTDESFKISAFLSVFYSTQDLKRARELINLVETNPTYSPKTKMAVETLKKTYEQIIKKVENQIPEGEDIFEF